MAADGAHARAREEQIRRLLAEHADRVVPGEGLPVIRARIGQPRRPWWRRAWDRFMAHTCDPREDGIDPTDVRCRICGQRPQEQEAAAPGQSGATAQAAPIREDTAMSHDLTEEHTPRGRQMAAALALAHLVEQGPAETAEWKVDAIGRLHGHVNDPHSDAHNRRTVAAFAEFLGTQVTRSQGRNSHSEWVHLSASGTYRGTPVNVWTHVDIRARHPYGSFEGRTA